MSHARSGADFGAPLGKEGIGDPGPALFELNEGPP